MLRNTGALSPWSVNPPAAEADSGTDENCAVFRSPTVVIDRFRAAPQSRLWNEVRFARTFMVVFPRTFVEIEQAGRSAVVASPNVATLYNEGQEFVRRSVGQPDCNEAFHFSESAVRDAVAAHDPSALEREIVFAHSHCPTAAATFLLQRRVYLAACGGCDDALAIEEGALRVLELTLRGAFGAWGKQRSAHRRDTIQWRSEAVRAVQRHVAEFPNQVHTLADLARRAHMSSYHLCRVFHDETGMTISAYVHQQRLRRALERLSERDDSLTDVAFELGYSSHSHFTARFRLSFGMTPSGARRSLRKPRARALARV